MTDETAQESVRTTWNGLPPWHGLGHKIPSGSTTKDILNIAGLDWDVKKVQMYSPVDDPSDPNAQIMRPVDGQFNLVRGSDHTRFSTVGSGYEPTQNAVSIDLFDSFAKALRSRLEVVGSHHSGRYIWGLAKMNYEFSLPGDDLVRSYVLMVNPHVLGQNRTIRHISMREVCFNTHIKPMKVGGFRLPNVDAFKKKMSHFAAEAVAASRDASEKFEDQATYLASKRADRDAVRDFMVSIFDQKELRNASAEKREINFDNANRTAKLAYGAIDKQPGRDMESAAGTWWGAFNAVTYVCDHLLSGSNRDIALHNTWLGGRAVIKVRALETAMRFAAK